MRKVLSLICTVAAISCSTVDKSHLSETSLASFPDHACLEEPDPGVTFEADQEFLDIVAGFRSDNFSTRSAHQKQLNDLLLTKNSKGRIRYLINSTLENIDDAEVKMRLAGALKICKLTAAKQVKPCPASLTGAPALVRPRGGYSEQTKDKIVIPFSDKYQVSKNDLFGVAGDSCREVAELTLERYIELEKIISNDIASPVEPFEVLITPPQDVLVSPEACCRQGRDVFLRLPDSYGGYKNYDRTAPTELQLVDVNPLSTEGFEGLCEKEGGFTLKADPHKNEFLKYASIDVIFLGHLNQAAYAVLTLTGSQAPKFQEPKADNTTATHEDLKILSLGCFKQGSDAEITSEPPGYDI